SGGVTSVAGTTALNGDLADFGGKVAVSGGTLRIDADMYTGGSFTGNSQAVAQQIEVSGGTLVLNGNSGFDQTFNYGSSTGVVRSSNVMVHGGGVLAGNASVGRTAVFNGGVLSPGDAGIGTLTISGDLFI